MWCPSKATFSMKFTILEIYKLNHEKSLKFHNFSWGSLMIVIEGLTVLLWSSSKCKIKQGKMSFQNLLGIYNTDTKKLQWFLLRNIIIITLSEFLWWAPQRKMSHWKNNIVLLCLSARIPLIFGNYLAFWGALRHFS